MLIIFIILFNTFNIYNIYIYNIWNKLFKKIVYIHNTYK